ncbi:efflux RND transporter periplasmic adaptor subunit [Methylobacterium komagatae]|uniref:Efflux RND transporter periplasmic adaptor subunit n=1 Tax=Methylobacterium komagatae TaxID=374425 RepID=A0ABW2BJC8_9HYPH|nr:MULTISPECIES: efflux RND transporter periplasmic adaptor subunit [Methylobacterium]MBY0254458.1 efflux RND transporter periplasmic adaptor subunit [Methylobacterium organophilum]MDE3744218.1 efflux RND transporter periplasmic adaptor subunit [Methylobacterium radiotolerans]MWV22642.1 efflux RND transporter periplasmic adaptor subunit [Methylobacterium sp. 2A]PVZ07240.1 Cu(I)/Ag(I) efflux system membrane fusion protein [Methylobacterium organophilum]
MSRSAWLAGILAASAAGGTGYWAGRDGSPVPVLVERARTESAHWLPTGMPGPQAPAPAKVTGPVVYYQDPDGKPVYSASPRTTAEGHDFRAVRASEDVRFDQARESEATSPDRAGHDVTGHGMAAHGTAAAGKPDGGARKVLYYRNPMGLPDTSTTPKKDSMGMDYIPVYAGEDEGGDVVTVSPGKVQRTGVRTETVERRVVAQSVRVPGTVALDERRVTVIATRSDAYVDHVEDVTTGDRVRKGQPLVHVYSPEINAAAAQLIANPGFDGARRRLQNLNVSEAVIDEMERTRKVPMAITWSSARDGVVLQRSAVEGMKAAAGDTLFRIGDISAVWVLADVPERDLAGVRVGQAVTVRLRSAPGRTFSGKVGVIYPQVNPDTRTTRVRIELPNPDGALLPDMYAEVEIASGTGKPVVAVPDDAVIDTGARQVVLLDRGAGRFEPREVKVGVRGTGFVEIRDGVAAGERVVTAANFLIDAESNLKAALKSMAAPKADDRQAANVEGKP